MKNLLEKNSKVKSISIFAAIVLLFITWYLIKTPGITLTGSTESVNEILLAETQNEYELENGITETETETEVTYPSQNFVSNEIPKITIEANAEEGIFPEGTIMKVKAISANETEQIKDKIKNTNSSITELNEEVVDILAVDITFFYNGEEIQPKDGKKVNVKISSLDSLNGENHKAIHIEGNGKIEKITNASVSSNEAKIEAESFSIYAIIGTDYTDENVNPVARYTYIFKVGTITVSTQTVKNGDYLVEPSVPDWSTSENTVFNGWRIEGETANLDFDTQVSIPSTETVDKTYTLYPQFIDQYKVIFYKDEQKTSVADTIIAVDGEIVETTNNVLLDMANEIFIGWYLEDDLTKTNVDSVTINGDNINLLPLYSDAYIRVHYDSMGGNYVESELIARGSKASEPIAPTKLGYTFEGWYLSQESAENLVETDKFNFETTISSNTILYAGWSPQVVNYKVAYYLEDLETDNYYYDSTKTKTGLTGTRPEYDIINDAKIYRDSTNAIIYFLDEEKTNESIENCENIKGDGSTILKVYYYRFYFKLRIENLHGLTKEYRVKNEERYYNKIAQDFPDISNYSFSYYFSYTNNERRADNVIKSISTLNTSTWGLEHQNKELIILRNFAPYVPKQYTFNLYLMNEKKNTNDLTNPNNYELDAVDTWTKETYNDSASRRSTRYGFEFYGILSNDNRVVQSNAKVFPMISAPYENKFFYRRVRNNISFYTGDGNSIETISQVPYEMPLINFANHISNYIVDNTTYTDNNNKTQIFKGWYLNQEFTGEPIDFSTETMPATGLYLYAKWEPLSYNVTFNPDNGEASNVVRVESGSTVERPTNPTKENYTFVGWKKANGALFDFNAPITEDITLTANWLANDDTVTYTVSYDAGEYGTFTLTDPNTYIEGSFAIILGTPTVTNDGKFFEGWRIGNMLYQTGTYKIRSENADEHNVITLTASYVDVPEKTKIIYNANGGVGTTYFDTTEVENNGTVAVLPLSSVGFSAKSLDTFICWNTRADGLGQNFYPGEIVAVNNTDGLGTTLYAVWGRKVIINKNDNQNNLIRGSVFKITRGNQTIYISDSESINEEFQALYGNIADGTADGVLNFNNLKYSTNIINPEYVYTLEEVNSPDGYYKFDIPIRFYVTQDDGIYIINEDEVSDFITLDDTHTTIKVKNIPHLTLPKTGGIGNYVFYIIGLTIIIVTIIITMYSNNYLFKRGINYTLNRKK